MGLFDVFTKEGRLKRHARRMGDRDALPEDRDASGRWLAEDGSRPAIAGLLTRFDMSLSNAMKDRAEKEQVLRLLEGLGGAVSEPLRAWMRRCKQYAWPLKLLGSLEGEEAVIREVLELLRGPVGQATFEPERRKELLVWLAEHPHAEVVDTVVPFLADFDEEVRYAAAEVLLAQPGEAARAALLGRLLDAEEESLRLKHRLAGVFRQRGWRVDVDDVSALPEGFAVQDGRIVAT